MTYARSRAIPYITEIFRKIEGMVNSVTGAAKVEITSPLESNGAIPVNIQDQTTPPIVYYFTQVIGIPTTVAAATAVDDLTVEVTDATGCTVGGYFGLFNADDPLDNRAYFGEIVAVDTNAITLDTPIDHAFQIGDTAACLERDMDVDGSTAPEIFSIQVGSAASQSIDITRIMIQMLTSSVPTLATFGNLAALTDGGLVLRRVNGTVNNIWNVKSNGDFANIAYDLQLYSAINPQQGQNGLLCRYTFAGQDKHGVAIRLNPGDELQLIIQDNLVGLSQFRVLAEGHYVGD